MNRAVRFWTIAFALTGLLAAAASPAQAQSGQVFHTIDGRVQYRNSNAGGIHVRLVRQDTMQPITETFTRPEGEFVFTRITDGDYLIETFETDKFEATSTSVTLRPTPPRSILYNVFIELPLKPGAPGLPPGVVAADVDLHVPKAALKHYRAGAKALESGDSVRAIAELREAIAAYSDYYAARLELGRELRIEKRYREAEEVLKPLSQIAPKRAEPRVEYGIVLLELQRKDEAVAELDKAVQLEEANWATHLYLGWALLESRPDQAEPHFKRAIELNERKAARAHLALARIAEAQGKRQLAIQHLNAYLTLAPDAPDAEAARKLADKLRQ